MWLARYLIVATEILNANPLTQEACCTNLGGKIYSASQPVLKGEARN